MTIYSDHRSEAAALKLRGVNNIQRTPRQTPRMAPVLFGAKKKVGDVKSPLQGEERGRLVAGATRARKPSSSVTGFENQFLDAPVQDFGDVELVLGGAGDFVNPAELSELLAGLAKDAENFSVESEFVDAAGKTVGAEEDLMRAGGDANGPGRAGGHGAGGGGGLVADGGAGVGIDRNVDGELAEEFSVAIENLEAAVAAVGDVDIVLRIDGDAMRGVELAGLVAGFAPGLEPVAVLVDFGDARIDVTVADVRVASEIQRNIGYLAEHAIDGRKRRLDVLERLGGFVGGLLFAAEDHDDAAFKVELDDHVGAFVGDPDVVVLVDFHGLGEGPGVEVVADLADEFSVGSKLEELRGAGCIGRAGAVAAREDEDVAFGIDGDASDFAEMDVGRKLQEVGNGVEANFGGLLGEKRSGHEKKQNKKGAFHVIQPRDFAPHHTRVWGVSRLLEICVELRREELRRGGPGERVENRQRVYWI